MTGLPSCAELAAIERAVGCFEEVALAAIHVLIHRDFDRIVAIAQASGEHLDGGRWALRECLRECRVQFPGFL